MTAESDGWESCTWEGAARTRRQQRLRLSLTEKIRMIEGLQEVAYQLQPDKMRMRRVAAEDQDGPGEGNPP